MTLYNKIKWIVGILLIFVLIVTTNLVDKKNFARVKESVVTIYEDRLIVNDLIFEMLKSVQKKELAVALLDTAFFDQRNEIINADMKTYIARYEETKLTSEESKIFKELINNLELLISSEKLFLASDYNNKSDLLYQISKLKNNLTNLSKIQLDEGKRQMFISKEALDTVELFTQIEIFILVLLAILVQIIVMYKPKQK